MFPTVGKVAIVLEAKCEVVVFVGIGEQQIHPIETVLAGGANLLGEREEARFVHGPIQPLEVKTLGAHGPK